MLGWTASWVQATVSVDLNKDPEFNQQRKQTTYISKFFCDSCQEQTR